MVKPIALCRISDTEPLMSILPMLEGAGYDCVLPDRRLRDQIRGLGCRNVDEFSDMHRSWGAELPPARLREIGPNDVKHCQLYVDVNGNLNGPKVWKVWPNLKDRVLTYFINGGEPRLTDDKGDCQTPTTPMATTAQHYRSTLFCPNKHWNVEAFSCDDPPNVRGYWTNRELSFPTNQDGKWCCPHGCGPLIRSPWLDKVYVFYPMFTRHDRVKPRAYDKYTAPVSFVHNCLSWGCQSFVEPARKLGVKAYGGGNSPDGLVKHEDCFKVLQSALCTVYLKGGGAVDYSILEPMACGVPTTFHWSYPHHCRLHDLLEPGVTCLVWKDEYEMGECIDRLYNPKENRRIGEAGRERMQQVTWNAERDGGGFNAFMRRMFPL